MLCGEATICSYSAGQMQASRLWCRSWNCEDCRPRRLSKLRRLAASGSPTTLITLTINPARFHDMDEAAQALVHGWRMVLQRAKREGIAQQVQYLAVFEETKAGTPHLHILARCPYIPQRWLSDRMREYCDSPIVDIRKIWNRRHASRYVAKYVSKGPGRFRGCKRYWRSQAYSDLQRQEANTTGKTGDAWMNPDYLESVRVNIRRAGWRVVDWDSHWFAAVAAGSHVWPTCYQPPPEDRRWRTLYDVAHDSFASTPGSQASC